MPQLDRTQLANELHDGVIQEMSAVLIRLETFHRKLEMGTEAPIALADLEGIKFQARAALRQLRELVMWLRDK
jgi:signal transduction histidine kinase